MKIISRLLPLSLGENVVLSIRLLPAVRGGVRHVIHWCAKWLVFIRRFSLTGRLGLGVVLIFLLMGIFAPYLSPYSPSVPSGPALEGPSRQHWLGTDDIGIDLWAQVCYGARISIIVSFGTALLAGIGGSIIGIFAGYWGGIVDQAVMRFTDMMIVLPDLPVMIVLGAFFGPSLRNVIIVLALFTWTTPARIVRSRIISIKQEAYVKMARSYGAGFWHLTLRHFMPPVLPVVMVSVIKLVSRAIVAEASLSFLGLGDPTSKSWGLILYHALNFSAIFYTNFWKWWVVYPLLAILLMVLGIALISRELEKVADRKL